MLSPGSCMVARPRSSPAVWGNHQQLRRKEIITRAKTVSVYVSDQARAVDFWFDKAGFDKRADQPMGPDARWIELAPPGADTVIVPFTPPGLEDRIGTFSGVVFECDDIQSTFVELRDRGVEFTEEPAMQPWGMMQAQFRDSEGNTFVLVQAGR